MVRFEAEKLEIYLESGKDRLREYSDGSFPPDSTRKRERYVEGEPDKRFIVVVKLSKGYQLHDDADGIAIALDIDGGALLTTPLETFSLEAFRDGRLSHDLRFTVESYTYVQEEDFHAIDFSFGAVAVAENVPKGRSSHKGHTPDTIKVNVCQFAYDGPGRLKFAEAPKITNKIDKKLTLKSVDGAFRPINQRPSRQKMIYRTHKIDAENGVGRVITFHYRTLRTLAQLGVCKGPTEAKTTSNEAPGNSPLPGAQAKTKDTPEIMRLLAEVERLRSGRRQNGGDDLDTKRKIKLEEYSNFLAERKARKRRRDELDPDDDDDEEPVVTSARPVRPKETVTVDLT